MEYELLPPLTNSIFLSDINVTIDQVNLNVKALESHLKERRSYQSDSQAVIASPAQLAHYSTNKKINQLIGKGEANSNE